MDFVGLVRTLPASKVAFGYGSGVFHQAGYSKEDAPMVDLVIGVQDALAWHTENMTKNPEHYSAFARAAGPRAVAWMQSSLGAGLWYNTLVVIPPSVSGAAPGQHMKYGIATVEALQRDLVDWESLYVAGRMHKPVRVILDDTGDAFTAAMERNRRAAVAAALLQLPESFTVRDFLVAVAGLSYAGDFRMVFGENPRKVENIVDGQFEQLASIYWPLLHDDFRDSVSLSGLEGDGAHSRAQDAAEPPRPSLLSIKGLVSAGPVKSATYSAAKLRKWAAAVMGGGSSPRRLQAMSLGLVGLATAAVSGVIGAPPPPALAPARIVRSECA
ncbi:hypothetical protein FNF31_02049 [Cafeteria roenbergensis]|uniref:Phosphatidate cytidylyltransferase, mitochondrial n=1 Tax=Cafeteria roenbergensis TaxID=33653 RepID=A0A5A8DI28_CAFRO|nr:hypothetical protein FNF31_02049 [Cafeteria roenbergensis]